MTDYRIVPATPAHAAELAANMREADVAEVWAGWRHTPTEAINRSIAVSRDPLAGLADGRVVCIFGVASPIILSAVASPWLLGAKELPRHSRTFLRLNRLYTRHIRNEYAILENYVDARNALAIRWLRWLGFTIWEPQPFGPDQLPFHRFGAYRDDGRSQEMLAR